MTQQADPNTLFQQASSLLEAGRLDEAISIYRHLAERFPNNALLLFFLGTAESQKGNAFEGARLLDESLHIDPSNADAHHNKGLALQHLKRSRDALQSFDRAIQLDPDFAEAYYNRGNALRDLNQLTEALQSYDGAIHLKADYVEAHNNRGSTLRDLKRLTEALKSFDRALQINPTIAMVHCNKGLTLQDLGQLPEALQSYKRALELQPDYGDAHLNSALAFRQLKQLDNALRSCERALALAPESSEAYNNKGLVLRDLKRLDEALESFDRAIDLKPESPEAHNNRGLTLQDLGRLHEALRSYERAIELKPDNPDAYNNKGLALQELKRLDEALKNYERAIELKPENPEAYNNKGLALQELKRLDEALRSYERAIQLKPENPDAYNNKGLVLQELKRSPEAIQSFDRALQLRPDFAEAYLNQGNALRELKDLDAALRCFDKAIAIKPDSAGAYFSRGRALQEMLDTHQARESYLKALELKPDYALARWALAFLTIPPIPLTSDDLQTSRKAFADALDVLDEWFLPPRLSDAHEVVGSYQPFYLAYQELNNKALLAKYGAICSRLMGEWQRKNGLETKELPRRGRIRLGIVSEKIHDHSVWNAICKGLVRNLDANKFELHIFYLGVISDHETALAQAKAATFTQRKPSLAEWARAILEKELEVLIYPEIGMDMLTTQLANLRLSPLQLAAWGHPETTGFPTIDYYISADLLEGDAAEDAYTEKLLKLPHLGCSYSRLPIAASEPDMKSLGVDLSVPILICPGTLFKYAPLYDRVFVEIAKRLGKCKFMFFVQQKWQASLFNERLRRRFDTEDLDFDEFVLFAPWLTREEFCGLMQRAHVFLDTIGFSGFNTAMQAVDCALPIVTREGRFLRGRLASGILKRIGMPELVVSTEEEYVRLVVRLVEDKEYREKVRKQIRNGREILYDDLEPVRALESFLTDMCRPST